MLPNVSIHLCQVNKSKKWSTSQNGYHISNYWVYGIQIDTHIDETIDKDIIDMVIASAITAWTRDALLQFVTKKQ